MIAIVDDGATDSGLLQRALHDVGARAETIHSVEQLQRASRIIVAGSGPFSILIQSIRDRGLVGSLVHAVLDGRPFLGIASGMHLLFDVSYEQGQHTGLGIISGKAIPFELESQHPVRRQYTPPHVGWAAMQWSARCPLLNGLQRGASFFFEHAAHAQPLDRGVAVASASFGVDFTAVVWANRAYGVQFLPEKSQESGQTILANFALL